MQLDLELFVIKQKNDILQSENAALWFTAMVVIIQLTVLLFTAEFYWFENMVAKISIFIVILINLAIMLSILLNKRYIVLEEEVIDESANS